MTDTSDMQLGQLLNVGKGGKFVPISKTDGSPVYIQFGPLDVLFEPSGYDGDTSRVELCLVPNTEVDALVGAIDNWTVTSLSAESARLFGKHVATEDLAEQYMSPIRNNGKGYRMLRLKMNTTGPKAVSLWDQFRNPLTKPVESWKSHSVVVRAVVKGVWITNKDVGLTLQADQCMLTPKVVSCPF